MAPEGRKEYKTNTSTTESVHKTCTIGRWIHTSTLPITFKSFKIRLVSIGYAKLKLGPFTSASGSDLKGYCSRGQNIRPQYKYITNITFLAFANST